MLAILNFHKRNYKRMQWLSLWKYCSLAFLSEQYFKSYSTPAALHTPPHRNMIFKSFSLARERHVDKWEAPERPINLLQLLFPVHWEWHLVLKFLLHGVKEMTTKKEKPIEIFSSPLNPIFFPGETAECVQSSAHYKQTIKKILCFAFFIFSPISCSLSFKSERILFTQ